MKKLIITILFYTFLFNNVWAALIISALYPNTDDDKNLEYIELTNSWSSKQSLSWYYLQDLSGKSFIFWSWHYLESNQVLKYYRLETKLILNNSDEEVYLYDNSWGLIDSFIYDESVKWVFLYKNTSPPAPLLQGEESNSWSLNENSWSWEIENNTWELIIIWTWIIDNFDTWTWIIDDDLNFSWSLLEIPNIEIEVQSWLDFLTWSTWKCKKEDCKINLNVEKIFTWGFLEKNYECNWNFWTWAIYWTWNEKKCNPGYVDYWSWIFDILVNVFEKNNVENFKTWSIIIENTSPQPSPLKEDGLWSWIIDFGSWIVIESWSWIIGTNTWELIDIWTWTWIIDEIFAPEVIYNFQSPTYFLGKEEKLWIYDCDSSKEECKVNLDFRNSFTWTLKESDFNCILDFWFWSWNLTWEENKCNPNTIIIPVWNFIFDFRIENKDGINIYSTWWFQVINNGYIKPEKKSVDNSSTNYIDIIEKIYIKKPEIIIQSWLDENNFCKKEECKINLNYEKKNSNEECLWDFWWWIFNTVDTDKKCNPWFVDYPLWNFEVKLRVYQKDLENNYKESFLMFENIPHPDALLKERENMEDELLLKEINEKVEFDLLKLNQIRINKVMPNPDWTDSVEYIELINNWKTIVDIKWCSLDDKLDWWSKVYNFIQNNYILPGKTKKYYKSETKLNLNNDWDEVNFYCWENKIDNITWNFQIRSWYYLNHERLDIVNAKVEVVDVIDWDTIKIKFLESWIIETLRLIWVDTPETKHPQKEVEKYWTQASNYTKKELLWKQVYLEIDKNNFRDKYSRLLGFVFLDWENFNKKLIELGYWSAYLQYDFKYFLDFKNAEKLAKKQKIWIWSEEQIIEELIQEKIIFEEEIIEKLSYLDENNNWIPDEFEEFIIDESFTWEIDENKLLINEEKSKLKYRDFVINSFFVNVSKLKSWLKLSWKAILNSDIYFEFSDKKISFFDFFINKTNANEIYNTKSDNDWNFSFLITDILSWEYIIESKIIDNFWNEFIIEKEKEIKLDDDYILEMNNYVYEKSQKELLKYSDEVSLINNENLFPIITIQWQLWNKKIIWNNIYCLGTCNINFDWSKSTWNIESYIWDFWNWEIFEWKNPKYIKYEKIWNYTMTFKIIWNDWEEKIEQFNIIFSKIVKNNSKSKSTKTVKNNNVLIEVTNANDESLTSSESEDWNNNWILYFFLIILFSLTLVFFLLKREELI